MKRYHLGSITCKISFISLVTFWMYQRVIKIHVFTKHLGFTFGLYIIQNKNKNDSINISRTSVVMLGKKGGWNLTTHGEKNEKKIWLYWICWHSFDHSLPLSKSEHLLVQVIRTYAPTANSIICIIPTSLSSYYLWTKKTNKILSHSESFVHEFGQHFISREFHISPLNFLYHIYDDYLYSNTTIWRARSQI